LLDRHAGLESRYPLVTEIAQKDLRAVEPPRQNQVRIAPKTKIRRHHADYRGWFRIDRECPPYDGLVASKAPLPIAVGEDHSLSRAGRIVGLRKPAAQQRLYAQGIEHPISNHEGPRQLRLTSPGHAGAIGAPYAEVLKRLVLVAIRKIHRRSTLQVLAETPETGRSVPYADQGLRMRIREGPDQYAIDHSKDGGVCADSQSERQQSRSAECRLVPQPAQRVAKITAQRIQPTDSVHLVDLLSPRDQIAGLFQRRRASLFRLEALREECLGGHFDVRFHFLAPLAVRLFTPPKISPGHKCSTTSA
jgi:hypothetical protein